MNFNTQTNTKNFKFPSIEKVNEISREKNNETKKMRSKAKRIKNAQQINSGPKI